MKLIGGNYYLVRKRINKKDPIEINFKFKSIDIGHNGNYLPASFITFNIHAIIKTNEHILDKEKILFLEIITGFNHGTIIRDRMIKIIDDLYFNETIEYYYCPGDRGNQSKESILNQEWHKELLPYDKRENKGCIFVFFISKDLLKEIYPGLLNSITIYTKYNK